jgi:hypothetical protein
VPSAGLALDDVPVAAKALLAVGTAGETALRVTVSSEALSCDDLASAYPERPPLRAGMRFDVWLMQPLETDGSRGPWSFRSAFISDAAGERGVVTKGAQLDDVMELGDAVKVKDLQLMCQDRQQLVAWRGDLSAKHCGRIARVEELRPQKEMVLTIAGERVAIGGASIRPEAGKHYLRLTRAAHQCGSIFTEGYDFYLDMAIASEAPGGPPKVQFVSLLGDIFPGDPSGSKGELKLTLDGPLDGDGEGKGEGMGEVTVHLDGTLDVSGYAVTMRGKLDALRCTPL